MRRETGEALLASSPQLRPGGPALSSLVGRIAERRGLSVVDDTRPEETSPEEPRGAQAPALSLPAGLVTVPPAGRVLEAAACEPVEGVALLGAHGGAGVSSLLRAGLQSAGVVDAGRCWPAAGAVLLVARTSTSGLEWAQDLARQHASGTASAASLLGLVVVADSPGRLPGRVAELLDLVSGAFPRAWQIPWVEQWRLAATSEPLPIPPEVARLATDVRAAVARAARPTPPTSIEGDLR